MTQSNNSIRAHIVTMGCAKNEVDSSKMAERLLAAGISLVDTPESADAVIVNTCCFIQEATEESLAMIFDMLDLENVASGSSRVIVAGCMPARYGDDLHDSLEEVKTFVPCSKEDDIAAIVLSLFPQKAAHVRPIPDATTLISPDSPSAYVKISDGCDRFCSFCAIPYIRGPYHSFTYEDVREEVSLQVARGIKEIVLIAQDTGRWGEEFEDRQTLAWLLDRLAKEFSGTWFRIMYLEPEGVTNELIECIKRHDNVCPYLDIPLQHVDPDILKSMNRKGSYQDFAALIAKLRESIEGITLRTTLIAGFPGETQEQFESLCDFLEEVELDYVGVSPIRKKREPRRRHCHARWTNRKRSRGPSTSGTCVTASPKAVSAIALAKKWTFSSWVLKKMARSSAVQCARHPKLTGSCTLTRVPSAISCMCASPTRSCMKWKASKQWLKRRRSRAGNS